MMSYIARSKRLSIVILSVILLVVLFTSSACVCEPGMWVKVDNQTDQTIKVFISGLHQEDVLPGEMLRFITMEIAPDPDLTSPDHKYLIEAKTEDREVVYSEEFTWQELDDMDWTIVIPPLP